MAVNSGECWTWYRDLAEPMRYGGSDESYQRSISWLAETCCSIEDWGAGTGYARKFVPDGVTYRAIDWAPEASQWVDITADLTTYLPVPPWPDGILLRHVLEHNEQWQVVLDHAVACFQKRLALVLFTPLAETTRRLSHDWPIDWSFRKEDLTARFSGLLTAEARIDGTGTQYGGQEHIFYLEKPPL